MRKSKLRTLLLSIAAIVGVLYISQEVISQGVQASSSGKKSSGKSGGKSGGQSGGQSTTLPTCCSGITPDDIKNFRADSDASCSCGQDQSFLDATTGKCDTTANPPFYDADVLTAAIAARQKATKPTKLLQTINTLDGICNGDVFQ